MKLYNSIENHTKLSQSDENDRFACSMHSSKTPNGNNAVFYSLRLISKHNTFPKILLQQKMPQWNKKEISGGKAL